MMNELRVLKEILKRGNKSIVIISTSDEHRHDLVNSKNGLSVLTRTIRNCYSVREIEKWLDKENVEYKVRYSANYDNEVAPKEFITDKEYILQGYEVEHINIIREKDNLQRKYVVEYLTEEENNRYWELNQMLIDLGY